MMSNTMVGQISFKFIRSKFSSTIRPKGLDVQGELIGNHSIEMNKFSKGFRFGLKQIKPTKSRVMIYK